MLHIALYHPQIPQNTGTLMRLGSCLGIAVDLIKPFGYLWDDRRLQRAGMDYLDTVEYRIHESFEAFLAAYTDDGGDGAAGGGAADGIGARGVSSNEAASADGSSAEFASPAEVIPGFETKGRRIIALEADNKYRTPMPYHQFQFRSDDIILAGSEHDGFAVKDLAMVPYCVKIPMIPGRRSLNVAIATAIVAGEAVRQILKD